MNKLSVLTAAAILSVSGAAASFAATIVDNSTTGLYNNGIGNALDNTSAFFPTAGDPTASLASAPDLSAAASSLGNWLTNPSNPGGTWSGSAVSIPQNWTVGTETAIIYEIDAGATGMSNVIASFGVDNGIAVWLNGVFVGGDQAPGGAFPNEYTYALGSLSAGSNYLQILREDHGGGTGYKVSVTGDINVIPLPAGAPLLLTGIAGFAWLRRKAKKA